MSICPSVDDLSPLARRLASSPDPEPAEKPLSRAQKKNVRKKQKKKEKKANEVAFEIEEVTTGFEEVTLSEKSEELSSKPTSKTKEEKVSRYSCNNYYYLLIDPENFTKWLLFFLIIRKMLSLLTCQRDRWRKIWRVQGTG